MPPVSGKTRANATLSSTNAARPKSFCRVRTCVIFNPAARGNKARHFRRHPRRPGRAVRLQGDDYAPGDTRAGSRRKPWPTVLSLSWPLAATARLTKSLMASEMRRKDLPARFGVLPLGTINVFARELKIPLQYDRAWEVLQRGHEMKIDLPCVDFSVAGKTERRYFVQLAGAGFDARAIELVDFSVKKDRPNGLPHRRLEGLERDEAKDNGSRGRATVVGELILVGNGKYYGGSYEILARRELARWPARCLRVAAHGSADVAPLPAEFFAASKTAGENCASGSDHSF